MPITKEDVLQALADPKLHPMRFSVGPIKVNSVEYFTGSAFLISLASTVASLSFFLFTLPVGVLADKVDSQKLICSINVGLAATVVGLAVLGWLHPLNPYLYSCKRVFHRSRGRLPSCLRGTQKFEATFRKALIGKQK